MKTTKCKITAICNQKGDVTKTTTTANLGIGLAMDELIERIEVFKAERIDGVTYQQLRIHYHCIGAIEFPESFKMPEVVLPTRQGVEVQYKQSA